MRLECYNLTMYAMNGKKMLLVLLQDGCSELMHPCKLQLLLSDHLAEEDVQVH